MTDLVVVGEVLRPRGLKGELLVKPLTWTMERFVALGTVLMNGGPELHIESVKPAGALAVVRFRGIDSREAAMKVKGSTLMIPRSEVAPHPEGGHFMFELYGMKVRRTDGIEVGTLIDVIETGSNLVYVVKDESNKETLIPAIKDVVEKLDFDNSEIVVRPYPGLFDE